MDIVILIGRILFGAIFFGGAIGHFTQTASMAQYTESKGIKPGRPAVLLSGAWMLIGAALVVVGAWADLGALMLAVFLLPTAVIMHGFWKEQDPEAKTGEQLHFNKDLSLAGAALALFGLFATFGDQIGLQLTGPLFG
ncbi:DoxX family protein [Mycolicibacillus parakoreensis]|uniref:DoxX family protein n=1 Tax=Mycolicibacillus parakoreensis TaxID=1069221 RepID=A0ABY3U182_9MYCO|nr:DoxX family protein [Mycolicibacillus parakoreensis]MCV7314174.1 DoxX family protein [Mycolicibacillus parakoreensis]ULN52894.1 DoxX family protein [Mycolicibacillus parakoreensis]